MTQELSKKQGFWGGSRLTKKEREEVGVDEAGGGGAAMAVEDADRSGGGRGEDLGLVFKHRIGLNHCHGVLTKGMSRQFGTMPQELVGFIAIFEPETKAGLKGSSTQTHQHPCYESYVAQIGFLASWNTEEIKESLDRIILSLVRCCV